MSNELTFGQKLVGLSFNPANNDRVAQIKQKMAEVVDIIGQELKDNEIDNGIDRMRARLHEMALHDILQAQMMAVKLVTFKD